VAVPILFNIFHQLVGPCLVIVALWIGMLLIAGIKKRHFVLLMAVFAIMFALGWAFFLKDYQKARVMSFFVPTDPLGISWSQNQAKIAVSTGGLWGKGIGQGSQTQYGFLSEPQTDFILRQLQKNLGF